MNGWKITWDLVMILSQAFLIVFSAWFACIGLFLFIRRKKAYPAKIASTRFAILVAARNEETVIGGLLDSLKAQDYPDELYDVYVAPNNCTDHTEETARAAGAKIFSCPFPVKSKGEVLHQAIPELLASDRHYDAVCIFDADNIVDPQFLARMNEAFCAGVRAAQGYRDSKNPYDSWVSGAYSLYFKMNNLFYNQARQQAGLSALISGTGFAVSREVFEELGGWNTRTLTEDSEFTAQCILAGERVAFVEGARFYDEQPVAFADSMKQRKRWSCGLFQVSDLNRSRSLQALGRKKKPVFADLFFFLLTPYFQMVSVLPVILPLFAALLNDPNTLARPLFWARLLLPLLTAYMGSLLTALAAALYHRTWDYRIIKGILGYGFFLLSWIPLQFYCLFRRDVAWDPIRHTKSVCREKLLKNEFS